LYKVVPEIIPNQFVPRKLASTKSVEYLIIDKIPKVIINDNKV
jgi:hypothetical protein